VRALFEFPSRQLNSEGYRFPEVWETVNQLNSETVQPKPAVPNSVSKAAESDGQGPFFGALGKPNVPKSLWILAFINRMSRLIININYSYLLLLIGNNYL